MASRRALRSASPLASSSSSSPSVKSVWRCSSTSRVCFALIFWMRSLTLTMRSRVESRSAVTFLRSLTVWEMAARVSCWSCLSSSTSFSDLAMDLVSAAWRSLASEIWSLRLAASAAGAGHQRHREHDDEHQHEQTEPRHGGSMCSRIHARHVRYNSHLLPYAAPRARGTTKHGTRSLTPCYPRSERARKRALRPQAQG